MKSLLVSIISLFTFNVFGAEVLSGHYDYRSNTVVVDVIYQGGCKEHKMDLQVDVCTRSNPMSCIADLIDPTEDDVCRGFVDMSVRFPAEQVLGDLAVERLTIRGDNDSAVTIEIHKF